MKRILLISAISLFLITTPALAIKDKDRDCDPDAEWKSHGEYVSCVAKLRLGGQNVSEAAKSDIGKEDDGDDDEDEPEASPSPSVSPSASPSASPFVSPSPVGIGTTNPLSQSTIEGVKIEISALIVVLQNIIESLRHLI